MMPKHRIRNLAAEGIVGLVVVFPIHVIALIVVFAGAWNDPRSDLGRVLYWIRDTGQWGDLFFLVLMLLVWGVPAFYGFKLANRIKK